MLIRKVLFFILVGLTHGQLTYTCVPGINEKVNITIEKAANNIEELDNLAISDKGGCTQDSNSTYYTLHNCQPDTDITVNVTLLVTDRIIDKLTTYIINCHWKMTPFTIAVPAADFGVTIHPSTKNPSVQDVVTKTPYPWAPKLRMAISPDKNIVVGTQLNITIASTEKNRIKFSADSCNASSTNNHHILWSSSNCSAVDNDLFGKTEWFFNSSADSITHYLQAFRFVDSYTVKVQCQVTIYPIGQENKYHLNCTNENTRRKRRAVAERTATVQTSFRLVHSVESISSTAPGCALHTSLISMAVLLYTYLHLF